MEGVKIITLGELVLGARPLTGTASFHPSKPTTNTPTPSPPSNSNPNPDPNPNPHPPVLTALKHPTILVGTLTLPFFNANFGTSFSSPCCYSCCLQFSDGSYSICCDILEFDPCVIGKNIHVHSWNFIPSKLCGGFLEIIKWSFPDSSEGLRNFVDSFPLVPNYFRTGEGVSPRAKYRVYGVLESVSPICAAPGSAGAGDLKGTEKSNSGSSTKLVGFMANVQCCECELCSSEALVTDFSGSIANQNSHSFTQVKVVYFIGHASSWHPVITKCIGKCVLVTGLKKKLVIIGKKESHVMYVTTEKSDLQVCRFLKKLGTSLKTKIKGKGECAAYIGTIKGVYMQGMVVELDNDVWLLLTEQLLTLPHGFRVGAIISIRNVHFVNPKFSWTKILILGACIKTSIMVESFSPLETMCHLTSHSRSMLGQFIQSLPFSARLWVLLLVSSLRKKFAGILSDIEILGSKHKEGLAQMCTSSQLPSSVFQTQNDAFSRMSGHDSSGCGRELHCGFLKLVIPVSTLICHCIATFMRMLKSEYDCKSLTADNHLRLLPYEARRHVKSVRKIIPSEDVGIVLLGNLKIAPSTGRLQLVDATGGIDVLIPDLPSSLNLNKIYEVMDYNIVVDGAPELVDNLELIENESLSCRTIFNCTKATRRLSISVYVYFLWKHTRSRNFPFHPRISRKDDSEILEPGSYHLLRVSHKFPLLQKFSDNPRMSGRLSTFVEAILLPWTLILTGIPHSPKVSRIQTEELSKYCIDGNSEEQVPNKRRKLMMESTNSLLKDEFGNSIYELSDCSNSFSKFTEKNKCINLSSFEISCLVRCRNVQNEDMVSPAILHCKSPVVDMDVDNRPTTRHILLEFSSESFLKYQLMHIGCYYILTHDTQDCICASNSSDCTASVKVRVDSGRHLWSLSLASVEVLLNNNSSPTSAEDNLSPCINVVLPKDPIEQLDLKSNVDSSGFCSDVCLYLPPNLTGLLEDNIMESEGQSLQSAIPGEMANISVSTGTPVSGPNLSSGSLSSNCLFPEGNLISITGNVVEIHDVGSSFSNICLSCASLDALRLKGFVGAASSFCIHVIVDHCIVKIFVSVSEFAFPTGFGASVNATFHRILDVRCQNEFMLIPVSFIVINSIRVSCVTYDASLDSIPSGLIFELNQCPSNRQMWLHSRIVAVFVLILEKTTARSDAQARDDSKGYPFDIPLAAFVLDDGSSSCCCWTNADRAAKLLRLHEKLPERASESSVRSSKPVGAHDNASSTTACHIGKVLKTYGRVTVRNYASVFDSACQDLVISVTSNNAIRSYDENLLKFIVINACCASVWNVLARVMDAEEVRQLGKEYLVEMGYMPSMQNVWAKEVSWIDPRDEARNMMQQVLNR